MLEKLKKENKGAVGIIMVIFILTLAGALALLMDISSTMFGMKEIQSKIDMAGINALYDSIDLRYLRNEEMGVVSGGGVISSSGNISSEVLSGNYKSIIETKYRDELNSINYPGSNPKVRKASVTFEHSNFGLGYNSAVNSSGANSRPQIVLESIVSYDVSASTLVDEVTRSVTKRVRSVHTGTDFTVTVTDAGVDGMKTVLVHSITRIVLK